MKTEIFKYKEFKDHIPKNMESVYINYMYFVGIKFLDGRAYLCFEAIDTDGRAITVYFSETFDDEKEEMEFRKEYTYLSDIKGFTTDNAVPALLQISCFHKNKNSNSYELYAKQLLISSDDYAVYTLNVMQGTFLGVMDTVHRFRNKDFIPDDIMNTYNLLNKSSKSVNIISNSYTVILRKIFISADILKKPNVFNKNKLYKCLALVTFKSVSDHFRVFMPYVINRNEYNSIGKDYFCYNHEELQKYESELEKEECFASTAVIKVEYSLTADNPMERFVLIGLKYKNQFTDSTNKALILEMSDEKYAEILNILT